MEAKVKKKYIRPENVLLDTQISLRLETTSLNMGDGSGGSGYVPPGSEIGGGGGGGNARSGDFFDDEEVDYYDDWL